MGFVYKVIKQCIMEIHDLIIEVSPKWRHLDILFQPLEIEY